MKITTKQLETIIRETIGTLSKETPSRNESKTAALKAHLKSALKHLEALIDAAPDYKGDRLNAVDDFLSDAINLISSEGPTTNFSAKHHVNLTEAAQGGAENGAEMAGAKDMVAFMKDFDAFVEKVIEEARTLADKGEGILKANLLQSGEAAVRNEIVKNRVNMLRTMANNMAMVYERVRRFGF